MKRALGSTLVVLAATIFLATGVENHTNGLAGSAQHATFSVHRLWHRPLHSIADSSPAYFPRVRTGAGTVEPVVYVLAGNNSDNCDPANPVKRAYLYAFNAHTGKTLWAQSTTGSSRCTTAGPVVGPSGAYVYAPGLDGKVHRYRAGSGKESFNARWPRAVTRMPDVEKMSATPTIANHYLYVTTSGFIGDQGHYEGHLVTIDLRGGRTANVFNSLCSNIRHLLMRVPGNANYCPADQSGLFGRGEGTVDPGTRDVYVVSGNGPWNGLTNWGDSILKLDPTGKRLLDAFTPKNQDALASADADLGSAGPAILPDAEFGGRTFHLLVQAGKGPACGSCSGAALRLLNRDDLSGQRGPGHLGGDLYDTEAPGGGEVLTAPAVWRSPKGEAWDIVANGNGIAGYRVVESRGKLRLERVWQDHPGGSTPVIQNGILYVATGGQIRAIAPASGAVLWQINGIGDIHWQYPLVVGHTLFITDQSNLLSAYSFR